VNKNVYARSFRFVLLLIVLLVLSSLFIIPVDADPTNQTTTTPEQTSEQGTRPLIRVTGDQNYPPYSYLDNGKPAGFDNDLIRAVADVMGFEVQIELLPWAEARQRLDRGEADVIAGMAHLESRDPFYDYSIPTAKVSFDLFVRYKSEIRTLEDARDKAIIVQQGGVMQEYLTKTGLTDQVITVSNVQDALWSLNLGDHDAALLNRVQGLYFIEELNFDRIQALGVTISPLDYGFAVREGNVDLINGLNTGLTTIKAEGIYDEIYKKWFTVYEPLLNPSALRFLTIALGIFLAIVTGILIYTWILSRKVRQHSLELQKSEEKYRLLIENTSEAVIIICGNKVVFSNKRAEEISGYTHEDIQQMNPLDIIHPDDRKITWDLIQSRLEHKDVNDDLLLHMVNKAGEILVVQSRSVLVEWEGKPAILVLYSDITHQQVAEQQIQQQVQRLAALREVDEAITSSIDLSRTLEILLEQVLRQLNVDAASVLLYNPQNDTLTYTTGRGFYTSLMSMTRLKHGQGFAWRAFLSRKAMYVPDMTGVSTDLMNTAILETEGLVAYYAIPLESKGAMKGILELFHRSTLPITQDWMSFAESIARQAAIAIDNASLFSDLQVANRDLTMAYDDTIRGWAIALELRDGETEGHSQRVTEMTERLARAMGTTNEMITHIRRGALLHDIGKMAIPDSILFKPGPLTREERDVMRRHPVYAYELLASIDFLRPAMDIPYSHHERWNGTGYPLGLLGDQIPLAARIFSVVDVWDALSSDRPYRKAWPHEDVINYLVEQSGKQFDPDVVRVFIQILEQDQPSE
jgi:PAS domain S-box-containing protein/putative nucleotidyltransferase with HDIG domain